LALENPRFPGVISAQVTDGPSLTEDEVPERLGGGAPDRLTEDQIVALLEGYRLEAEYARLAGPNSRDQTWLEHLDLYYNRWDMSKKAPWQAREVMPEFPQYVDRFAAAMRMALVAQPQFFTVSCDNDEEGDLAYVIRKYMEVVLRRVGRNPSGHPVDFSAIFEEAMKMGALSMVAFKVTQKDDGRCGYTSLEIVDPYNVWLDPTNRNLYRIHREELDLHELRALMELEDTNGEPLFRRDAAEAVLQEAGAAIQALMRAEREKRTGTGQWMMSQRRPVVLHEYYCDLIDNEGYVRAKKALFIVANNKWLVRGQQPDGEAGEENPFWHGKDWMVISPIITVPLAPYGRSYAENFASLTRTFNEMTNLLLDSIMVSTMKIFSVVPGYMEDPSQLEDGIYPNAMFRLIEGVTQEEFIHAVDMGRGDPMTFDTWKMLKQELQEGAAFNEMTLGNSAPQGRTSATEINTVDQNSTTYMRAIASNVETLLLEPTLDLIWKTSIQHLDPRDEEIKQAVGEKWFKTLLKMKKKFATYRITFQCRGITSLLARKQKLQEFLQFLQIAMGNPVTAQILTETWPPQKLLAYLAMLMDVDVSQLEGSPREMKVAQMEKQQQQQKAQQQAGQQMQLQAQGKGMEARAVAPAKIAEAQAKEEARGQREAKIKMIEHLFEHRAKQNDDRRELQKQLIDQLLGTSLGGQGEEGGEEPSEGGDSGSSTPAAG